MRPTLFLIILIGCSGCAMPDIRVTNHAPVCGFGDLRFDTGFEGARLSECRQTGDNEYSLGNAPENTPVNSSPWYAFRVLSERERTIRVFFHYGRHRHRYRPKISRDGRNWRLLDESSYQLILDETAVRFTLRVGPEPLYVAAQELVTNSDYAQWREVQAALEHVEAGEIGRTLGNRPIHALTTAGDAGEWVLIVGRQHPPEITGALALFPFVERLLEDDQLAQRFRRRYRLLIVPNLNPDGVASGHWRHNYGGVDLNRDWGLFTQPETRAVIAKLERVLQQPGQRLVLGLDFHSTRRDVFYTQEDGEVAVLPDFTADWLQAIASKVPGFKVDRAASRNSGRPVFKHYISETYGVPAITYEMGDRTDRELIRRVAVVAAELMMKLLADAPQGGD